MNYAHRHKVMASLDSIKYEDDKKSSIAWAKELGDEENMPTLFTVTNGQMVSIPVSKKDLKMLEELGERVEICNWQIEWRIQGSEVIETSPPEFHATLNTELIATALNHINEFNPDSTNVEATLSHLSLYRAVEAKDDLEYDGKQNIHRGSRCDVDNFPGSFATLVLQIPVAGGHRGGEFRLHNRTDRSVAFSTFRNSHRFYHVTVFYDDCQESVEPITKGSRLEFVYNLRYKTVPNDSDQHMLEKNHSSPLYRIWQLPIEPPTIEDVIAFSKKEEEFRSLFEFWKMDRKWLEQIVIPLDHSYGNNLSFNFLKGMDRSTVKLVTSLLGGFVEIHLAIAKKYIGYKEEDWIASGKETIIKKTGGKRKIFEKDWTEYWVGNWVDCQGRQLLLPPIPFTAPDELLGLEEMVFQPDPTKAIEAQKYDGYFFERTVMVIWPKNQTFFRSLVFGLDQALDVVEAGLETEHAPYIQTPVKFHVQHLLEYCKREPNKSWFASTTECSDFRCDRARSVSLKVASERSLRLINLCIRLNLPDCGLQLLRILFGTFKQSDYRCYKCFASDDGVVFVGGICSNSVAEGVAKLIAMLGWNSIEVQESVKQLIQTNRLSNLKQIGQMAFFVSCLFHRQYFEAAMFVGDHVFQIMINSYLKESIETRAGEGAVSMCIDMLFLIDGLPFSEHSRLNQLLSQLKLLSTDYSSTVLGWLQAIETNTLKSLPFYWKFYMDLITGLESQLATFDSPSYKHLPSLTKLEKAAAQLMISYLKVEDDAMLNTLIDRVSQPTTVESRNMLSALISSRWIWAVPSTPIVENVLVKLSGARFSQLSRFKFHVFKWEQPDAVLKEHPVVETFLRSSEECMTYCNFTSEEEAHVFSNQWFGSSSNPTGYSAAVVEIGSNAEGVVFTKIRKTPDIYESSLKQLETVEDILNGVEPPPESKSTSPSVSLTPDFIRSESPSVVVKQYSRKRTSDLDLPSKRSKRTTKSSVH